MLLTWNRKSIIFFIESKVVMAKIEEVWRWCGGVGNNNVVIVVALVV